jgi:hypothetical protein
MIHLMTRNFHLALTIQTFVGISILYSSCATSMAPSQVNQTLLSLTKSKYITTAQAGEAININKCKFLVGNREYVAPIGLTTKQDLVNGAQGIDEWVKIDGVNSYVLRNYKWVTVDQGGTTELHLEFDTLLCE